MKSSLAILSFILCGLLSASNGFVLQASSGLIRPRMSLRAQGQEVSPLPSSFGHSIFEGKLTPAGFPSAARWFQPRVIPAEELLGGFRDETLTTLTQGLSVALILAALSLGMQTPAGFRSSIDDLPTVSEYIPPQAAPQLKAQYLPKGNPLCPGSLKLYITTVEAGNKVKDHTLTFPQKFME